MPKPNTKSTSIEERMKSLMHQLQNAPHGLPLSQIPEDQPIRDQLAALYKERQAIWVKHPDDWYYVLLRNGNKPPLDISNWVWQ